MNCIMYSCTHCALDSFISATSFIWSFNFKLVNTKNNILNCRQSLEASTFYILCCSALTLYELSIQGSAGLIAQRTRRLSNDCRCKTQQSLCCYYGSSTNDD